MLNSLFHRGPTVLALVLLAASTGLAQQSPQPQQGAPAQPAGNTPPVHRERVVVTGTYQPVAAAEVDRDVTTIDLGKGARTSHPDLLDALRLDPAVDLQERGPAGVQADLSIRGSQFGQNLVLVNGLRLNDAQSGHHNLDLPLPFLSLDRIEVLHGSGSTLYGSDAVGGVVNFITAPPLVTGVRLGSAFGNFGINQQYGTASMVGRRWTEQLSFGRDFSTGFIPDRDYRRMTGSSETHLQSRLGATMLLLAGGDTPFGANQFYGPYASWERTKSWFAGITQELGRNTQLAFGYRRHSDLFELLRANPGVYTNDHVTESYQLALRRHDSLGRKVNVFYGAEGYRDSIDSNNFSPRGETAALGRHTRDRGAIYAAIEVRPRQRLTLSAGGREEYFSGGNLVFAPTFSAGYRLSERLKLRGSIGRAFRLPTYTDLYYQAPGTQGNPGLAPETAWSYEGGVEWTATRRLSGSVTVFHRHEENNIDYVEVPNGTAITQPLSSIPVAQRCTQPNQSNCVYQARNLNTFGFTGVEAAVRVRVNARNNVSVGYTALHGAQQALNGFLSRYLFNYAAHNASLQWESRLPWAIQMRTRVLATQRYQNDAYALWDLALSRQFRQVRPFLRLTNLGNTSYQEVAGVAMPGRTIVGGMELELTRKSGVAK